MLPHEFRSLIPDHPIPEEIATYKITHQFYQEAHYRQELENYSQWYYETATKHQRELAKMQGDINILGWVQKNIFGRN